MDIVFVHRRSSHTPLLRGTQSVVITGVFEKSSFRIGSKYWPGKDHTNRHDTRERDMQRRDTICKLVRDYRNCRFYTN
ncbi:hypothetical protein RB9904 [Rhodopirellula baltica SH 1]|uniref:Uncharacterized protein n=1 Tax=Rhodopirellula baltica (strain DSM 10527 / NCIMB 13988 / SH1) TaxID=243090 RepID=Q7UKV9_RHOBA|nr:hypothetical protein RB9904 [Rhodopirellula baltica SH 1]